MWMTPYDYGVRDKEDGNLEPTPEYEPGSEEYSQYAEGYLSVESPNTCHYNRDANQQGWSF